MPARALSFVGLGALTVAAAAVAVVALSGAASVREPAPVSSQVAAAYESLKAAPPTLKEDTRPHAVVIGDSYSQGANNTVVWPVLVSEARKISITNKAVGGVGYAVGEKRFIEQAKLAVLDEPDIIIVAGSRNDVANPAGVQAAADEVFTFLKQNAPGARIVIIGPMWSSSAPDKGAVIANEGVRTAAEAHGLAFIDALAENWLSDPAWIQKDGVHPTDAGEAELANHIGGKLAGLGI
ncbi:SGNH/GDSL hydrolase family protein [Arthrobacter sp. PsM3]|uniref:SGNH/GDSL hydrolase family protein n=1 Tax=Arthrobacter sp. PsM3 TaxID=3030531 RepID=UPI00263B49F0|nr:SGNH/GDSL hydrolase family protein [Arthrobacter sp. PsM3]MDN4646579.1 SGNH/GDSL hydrolase family protein [Arthrobacter sp. PsM3]